MSYEIFLEYYQQMHDILANNTFQEYGIIGLFLNSLLSATAIPLPTEILTSALLIGGENIFLVGIVLVLGSTIGGILNYFIGFGGNRVVNFFRMKKQRHERELSEAMNKEKEIIENKKKHTKLLDRFGWSAIFFAAWIPVVGDLILISAGAKKMKFTKFSFFMITGKIVKTIVVVIGLGSLF